MKIIITGGAGFIGSNAAMRYLKAGHEVIVIDSLTREGTRKNLNILEAIGGRLHFLPADIREAEAVQKVFERHRDVDRILHLAAQVAVTTSVQDPMTDFETNALGTLNVLEAMRRCDISSPAIYSSTNKVYGEMMDAQVVLRDNRWAYTNLPAGVSEERCLDFHSPYGCSKGAADQYFVDYHRIYGLNTTVMRQSCIYGYRQFGAEDQGWVAWFMIACQTGRPITIFGDGKQVRDILFVDDLLDAYDAAFSGGREIAGRVYNIGGGPENVLSLLELVEYIEQRQGSRLKYVKSEWRPGDQKVFVSDIRRAYTELGWKPKIGSRQGLDLLYDWIGCNLNLFEREESELLTPAMAQ